MEKTKYRVKCNNCGELQMFSTDAHVIREPYTKDNMLPSLECEVCGWVQLKPDGAEPAKPVLSKAPTNGDAHDALTAIHDAAKVLIEHAESSDTVFVGVVTTDYGHGHTSVGDFFVGDAEHIALAFRRLFNFRPELVEILEYAIAGRRLELSGAQWKAIDGKRPILNTDMSEEDKRDFVEKFRAATNEAFNTHN